MLSNDDQRVLFLHIGTGKAGSTSIQHSLKLLNDPALDVAHIKSFGNSNATLLAAACGGKKAYEKFVTRRKRMSDTEFEKNTTKIWENTRRELKGSRARKFVASSEFLISCVRDENITNLKLLLDEHFDDVKVVVYLREQLSFVRSLWAQRVKGPKKSTESFRDFLLKLESNRYMWDYSLFLKSWMDVFGREAMMVTAFDSEALFGGDVVSDLINKIGINNPPEWLYVHENKNVSPPWKALEEIRLQNLENRNAGPPKAREGLKNLPVFA